MKEEIKKIYHKILPAVFTIAGSLIISFSWIWYHYYYRRHDVKIFVLSIVGAAIAVWIGFYLLRFLFTFLTKKFNRDAFWYTKFVTSFPTLFFNFALLFVVFLIKNELLSLLYTAGVLALLFKQLDRLLGYHPNFSAWQKVNRSLFLLFFFFFLLNSIWQFLAYKYYILNINNKYFNIVLFRTITVTMVWLGGFAIAALIYLRTKKPWRWILISGWFALFLFSLFIWTVNIGVLYFSGLYFSPLVLSHAEGGLGVLKTGLVFWLITMFILSTIGFVLLFRRMIKANNAETKHCWSYYYTIIIGLTIGALVVFSSFKTTPEYLMAQSFIEHYKGYDKEVVLPQYILEKLKKFGLNYNPEQFSVAHKEQAFATSSTRLLPEQFDNKKPNVIIFFLESFSARLTDVYNPKFSDVTPNFDSFVADPDTTIFKNYYNSSFPTITGIMAQLCSYYPPTGHTEIATEKRFQTHHLLCLPKVLREKGGYNSAIYATAVDKDFANKDSIFGQMGIDKVYGKDELGKMITGEPLGWGYTDHQIFPLLLPLAREKLKEPFLLSYSSIDTHIPFTLSTDMPSYQDNSNAVLQSFHSTDDAFGKFWEEFKKSEYYNNTIVITVADHSVFASAYRSTYFPNISEQHNEFDEQFFLVHIPNNVLPKEVNTLSTSVDFTPTLLQMLNINTDNSFEGHSIFDDRDQYPELIGMYERALYINQSNKDGSREIDYGVLGDINCTDADYNTSTSSPLTICELNQFYKWKRKMVEEGRFWDK